MYLKEIFSILLYKILRKDIISGSYTTTNYISIAISRIIQMFCCFLRNHCERQKYLYFPALNSEWRIIFSYHVEYLLFILKRENLLCTLEHYYAWQN